LRFKDRLANSGARVVFVSVEDDASGPTIESFKKTNSMAFDSYRAPHGGLADAIEISYSVPRTFVLAPGGQVVDELYGDQPWDDAQFEKKVRTRLQLPSR
jgi:hypothetical protein